METVKISVDVNVNLSESTQEFIKNLFSVGVKASEPVVKESATEVTEPKRTRKKKVESTPEAEPEAEAPAEPEAEAPAVSIEDVRKVLAEKVNEHRAAIKDKLIELGAPSVTKLDPSKYEEMFNFLKSLWYG